MQRRWDLKKLNAPEQALIRAARADAASGWEAQSKVRALAAPVGEEQIYRGIGEDFEWFEDVVGPAQPVLNQVESAIESVAMHGPSAERRREIEERVREIRDQTERAKDQDASTARLIRCANAAASLRAARNVSGARSLPRPCPSNSL